MATLQNERDKTLQATNPRLIATTIVISGTAALFVKPNAVDPITPTSITLTGVTTIFTSPTIKWYYASNADMTWNDFNITGTNIGANRVLTSADFITQLGTGTKVLYKATAEQTGFSTSESLVFEVAYSDLSATGTDGQDAYHIRLDNESRIVRFDYTDNPISGQLPVNAQVYVTKGATDVTVGSGFITYSINSVLGATGASVNSSTGAVTVTGITLDVNYVEIAALVEEPDLPAFTAYKKLYINKFTESGTAIDVDISQDHAYYQYANATSTTNIAAWSTINFTAAVKGPAGATVTWSAKTYDSSGTEIAGSETIFSYSGNTASVTAAQFVARGGNTVDILVITATYSLGGVTISDSAAIKRNDGTNGTRYLDVSNEYVTMSSETDGSVSAGVLASEGTITMAVLDISTDAIVDDTPGWSFTATPSTGITVSIEGAGNGPYVASAAPVTMLITAIDTGSITPGNNFTGTITVVATKDTFPNVQTRQGTISVTVAMPAVGGATLDVQIDKTIVLPVDSSGNIIGYSDAIRTIRVMNGSQDDTANWTLSRTDGPGVTSTLTSVTLTVTNFVYVPSNITFTSAGSGTFTGSYTVVNSSFAHNENGTFVVALAPGYNINNPHIFLYSNDYGVTWGQATVPVPPATYSSLNSAGTKYLTYYKPGDSFVYLYEAPMTGGNGRVIYSTNGSSWTASTLPNTPGGDAWAGLTSDNYDGGKIYLYTQNGRYIYHSTDLTSWTSVDAGSTLTNARFAAYSGNIIRHAYGAYVGQYSSTLTNWTNYSANSGNTNYSARSLHQIDNVFVSSYNDSGGSGKGLACSTNSSANVWKFISIPSLAAWHLIGKGTSNDIYISVGINPYGVFVTNDKFSSLTRCTISGPNPPVINSGSPTYSSITTSANILGQPLVVQDGVSYIPAITVTSGTPNTVDCYMGAITPGNNGTESYITITATPNDTSKQPLTTTVIVRKAAYTGDIYSLVVSPGTIQLPSTSDGIVYPSAFTNNNNVANYTVLKNGLTYTGGITGSISATTGVTAAVTGNGTNTGTVTVSAMTDAATEPAFITGIVSIDDVTGPALSVNIKVVKLKDGNTSGVYGSTVSGFTAADTIIYIRFNPSGTVEIKRGSGSYVRVVDWYYPVNTISTPGSNYWINMNYTSDTSDVLVGDTSETLNTWLQLNSAKAWKLTNAASGTHRVYLNVKLGTSSSGANAIIGSGTLELEVP